AQSGAVADDLPEVVVGAHLLFQVKILLGQPVFQLADLPIGLRVRHGNGDLLGDLTEQIDFLRAEGTLAAPADIQRAQAGVVEQKWSRAKAAHAFANPVPGALRFPSQALQILLTKDGHFAAVDRHARWRLAVRVGNSLFDERLVLRKGQHVDTIPPRL